MLEEDADGTFVELRMRVHTTKLINVSGEEMYETLLLSDGSFLSSPAEVRFQTHKLPFVSGDRVKIIIGKVEP